MQQGTIGLGSGYTSRVITSPDGDILEDKIVTVAGSQKATAQISGGAPSALLPHEPAALDQIGSGRSAESGSSPLSRAAQFVTRTSGDAA